MNYLTADNLSKSFGAEPLFENISLSLSENQKTALIAANGSGKTTLLKILAGKEVADTGQVVVRKSVTVGYLEQEPAAVRTSYDTAKICFLSENATMQLVGDYELALHAGANYINANGQNFRRFKCIKWTMQVPGITKPRLAKLWVNLIYMICS
jgi:ATP-binding cassette subfamily F protein uup